MAQLDFWLKKSCLKVEPILIYTCKYLFFFFLMFSMFIFSLLGKTHENIFQMSKIFIILFGSSKVNLN